MPIRQRRELPRALNGCCIQQIARPDRTLRTGGKSNIGGSGLETKPAYGRVGSKRETLGA